MTKVVKYGPAKDFPSLILECRELIEKDKLIRDLMIRASEVISNKDGSFDINYNKIFSAEEYKLNFCFKLTKSISEIKLFGYIINTETSFDLTISVTKI